LSSHRVDHLDIHLPDMTSCSVARYISEDSGTFIFRLEDGGILFLKSFCYHIKPRLFSRNVLLLLLLLTLFALFSPPIQEAMLKHEDVFSISNSGQYSDLLKPLSVLSEPQNNTIDTTWVLQLTLSPRVSSRYFTGVLLTLYRDWRGFNFPCECCISPGFLFQHCLFAFRSKGCGLLFCRRELSLAFHV
jgi:hypothetical protein